VITEGEKIVKKYRRSIYSIKLIKKGEIISKNNIKIIRPGYGLPPEYYNKILGKVAIKNIKIGQPLKFNLIKNIT
jgi:N-acetylneuraminate synthase